MSFILDALKKADRERHLNKIPTLATVHIPVYMKGRRVAVWAVAALLLGAAVLVWWLQPSTIAPVSTLQPLPSVAITPPARPSIPERGPASDRVANVPMPFVPESAVPAPRAAARSGVQRQAGRDRSVSPGPARPAPQPLSRPPVAPIQPEVQEVPPARVDPPAMPLPRPEPQPSVEASQPLSPVVPAAPPSTSPATPTLREALSKMTLDVFVYTDVEADRMAVINGRRYFKGQFVDGLYLVESINPDGVMLKYRDERAVLRP